MTSSQRPASRADFRVAIICALPREADAICLLFDQFYDEDEEDEEYEDECGETDDSYGPYGRAEGDLNTYTTGRIGKHNVVLTVLPNMGTTGATGSAASMRSSYCGIRLMIIVGICGGVPRIAGQDAFLGDVVVSKSIVQYDYGRQYPGSFVVKNTVDDSLGRAHKDIRGLLASLETEIGRERLRQKAGMHLRRLQGAAAQKHRRADYRYPGAVEDRLFPPNYAHVHRMSLCYGCVGAETAAGFCEEASTASCDEMGCNPAHLVARKRRDEDDGSYTPEIFIGCVASGNTVMKSGTDRDRIAAAHNIIAFEMEGAGVWDELPCIVVKGICDYADSHKNKRWQDFAAATAASVTKAILGRYSADDAARARTRALARARAQFQLQTVVGRDREISERTIANSSFGGNAMINLGDIRADAVF